MNDGRARRQARAAGVTTAAALAGTALVAASSSGMANPKGGQVSAGAATIHNASPTQLDVVQSTNRAVIDWQSFDIATGERTNFQQPSTASMTLNRVHAPDPSTIAGQLNANGSLVLINPNGVVFSRGSQVNVHSIIATPTDISNANFMAGKMRFDRPSPNPNARVVNDGSITVAQKGLAALVAPGVANSGVIQANLGRVVLAGAETFTVDFYGDGLINFDVGSKVAAVPRDANGVPLTSLVSNTGTIDGAGGTVLLTADAAAGILANVIDASGRINAPTAAEGRGAVTIDAGAGNAARLAGTIDVSASAAGQTGGTTVVTGGTAQLASTARINARGPAGGGTVKIGGGAHGTDATVRNALNTAIAAGAIVDASATDTGNGGTVAIWSDGNTVFNGEIYAGGGPNGGNGGWVETSGHTLAIADSAVVDASPRSSGGSPGLWLLDPTDLTVVSGDSDSSVTDPPIIKPTASPATVSNTTIQNALNGNSDVILDTKNSPTSGTETGAITVNAPIGWSTGTTLTLDAAGNITINSPITGTDSGSVLALNAAGTVSQSATGTITVGTLTGTSTGGTTLTAANSVDTLGSFINSGDGSFSFKNTKSLTVAGPINGGSGISDGKLTTSVLIETTGLESALTIAGLVQGNNVTKLGTEYSVRLQATGAIAEASTGSIRAGKLLARTQNDAGAAITLNNPANAVPSSVTLSTLNASGTARASGAITFFDSTGFIINGVADDGIGGLELGIATTGKATLQAAGTIRQNGSSGIINAQSLVVSTLNDAGADILLGTADNAVPGNVTLTTLNAAGTALAPGTIDFFNTTGFTIASLGGLQSGVATASDAFLISEGAISEAVGAAIAADYLYVEASGGAVLTGANEVNSLELYDFESGPLSFTNIGALTVLGAESAGALTLRTTGGTDSKLTLDGDVTGAAVTLVSSGPITQTAGIITADTLTGSAGGLASFRQGNLVDSLDGFSTTAGGANGDFTLRNAAALTVSDTVGTGSGALTLDTGASALTLATPVSVLPGGALLSTGTINLTADNMVVAAQVGGSAQGVGSAAQVNVTPSTANQPISLGAGAATGLALDTSELNTIRAAQVNIGNGNAGALTLGAFTAADNFATTLLSLTTGGTTTFNGSVVLNGGLSATAPDGIRLNGGAVTTAAAQTYNDPVVLTDNAVLTSTNSGDITFAGTVDSLGTGTGPVSGQAAPFSLTVNTTGTTLFDAQVGFTSPLASLTTDAAGRTDLNGGAVTTSGAQLYGDPVQLTANAILTSTTSGDITFASTLNSATAGAPFDLTVNTAGTTRFEGTVGNAAALLRLTTDAPGTTDLNGGSVTTLHRQTYNDPVVLTANSILTSTDARAITFLQTVDGAFDLTVNTAAVTRFDGQVGSTTPLASLTTDFQNGDGERTAINGLSVRTTGPQTYNDPVQLTANLVLTSAGTGAAGDITFASTLDSYPGGPFGLTVNTAGTTTFAGAVGTTPLASLTTDAAGRTDLNGGAVTTSGAQLYGDPVQLTVDAILTSTGSGEIGFASSVSGDFALTVNTGGTTRFEGPAALASLTTDSAGRTDLNGGAVTTSGAQLYGDPVQLTADATLTSTGSGNITFASTVDSATGGPFGLSVNTGGTTAFQGAVGGAAPLLSLTTDGTGFTPAERTVLTAGVNTTGLQTYNDAVQLANTVTLAAGGVITFDGTVDATTAGGQGLTVNTAGTTTFAGAVGATPLASLTTDAAGRTDLNGGTVTTTGAQLYGGPVQLTADAILTSTGSGNITFASTVDSATGGAFGLSVNTGGTTTFAGAVGGATPLASLDATSAAIAVNAPITTAGLLTLNATSSGALTIASDVSANDGDLRLAAPAGAIALTGPIRLSAGQDISVTAGGALELAGPISDGSLALVAGRDILLTSGAGSNGTGSASLTGMIAMTADRAVAIASDSLFSQSGTLSVDSADYLIIDTTGATAERRIADLTQAIAAASVQNNPDPVVIANPAFNSSGLSANAIEFDGTLNAENSVVLLVADQGKIRGGSSGNPQIFVGGLGVSGTGGEARLFGSVAGNLTEAAAAIGRINPQSAAAYLVNNCIIGLSACALPTLEVADILLTLSPDVAEALLRPQSLNEVDILVANSAQDDIDAPLVNIFDEERLCELLLRANPELAREACR